MRFIKYLYLIYNYKRIKIEKKNKKIHIANLNFYTFIQKAVTMVW